MKSTFFDDDDDDEQKERWMNINIIIWQKYQNRYQEIKKFIFA
jgi:hypothetical protein